MLVQGLQGRWPGPAQRDQCSAACLPLPAPSVLIQLKAPKGVPVGGLSVRAQRELLEG